MKKKVEEVCSEVCEEVVVKKPTELEELCQILALCQKYGVNRVGQVETRIAELQK